MQTSEQLDKEQWDQANIGEDMQALLHELQEHYAGNDEIIACALSVALLVHLRACLLGDENLQTVDRCVNYLNGSFAEMLAEFRQLQDAKKSLH
jgi:hypothetical protein